MPARRRARRHERAGRLVGQADGGEHADHTERGEADDADPAAGARTATPSRPATMARMTTMPTRSAALSPVPNEVIAGLDQPRRGVVDDLLADRVDRRVDAR